MAPKAKAMKKAAAKPKGKVGKVHAKAAAPAAIKKKKAQTICAKELALLEGADDDDDDEASQEATNSRNESKLPVWMWWSGTRLNVAL
ncbi:unnamed protein product [Amoebophrya sp. A120]|nr:unnamed protein product [Amoebophrya sp. A120]|eukprot:GSA120T00021930001.1